MRKENINKLKEYRKMLYVVDMVNGFVNEGVLHDKHIRGTILHHLPKNNYVYCVKCYFTYKLENIRKKICVCLFSQSCLTLCNPMDCSLPGSSTHGILQARILE